MKIPLTKGYDVIVDSEDYLRLSKWNWSAAENRDAKGKLTGRVCAYRRGRLDDGDLRGKTIYMHREIMNAQSGLEVDHCDGNGLNNRRNNLRVATKAQNGRNRAGPNSNNKSGFLGVSWSGEKLKWVAAIHPQGKTIILGYFEDAVEAARTRDRAAVEHFGEFARLNLVETQ